MFDSAINHAPGVFAPGHLGELTRVVPFDMVDAALEAAGGKERRVQRLPSRVVIYLLLAGVLFADQGWKQVFSRLGTGLPAPVQSPSASALSEAMRRVGSAPVRELFSLVKGPAVTGAQHTTRFAGRLVVAIDGTQLAVADTEANRSRYPKPRSGPNGEAGYPMIRLVAILTAGNPFGHRGRLRHRCRGRADLRPPGDLGPAIGHGAARGSKLRHLRLLPRGDRNRCGLPFPCQDRGQSHATAGPAAASRWFVSLQRRRDVPDQATSAATSNTSGLISVRCTGLLSLLNLFSEVSLISSGQGCPGCAGRSWRPSSRPVRVERIVDRPTIRSCPSTGKPATMAWRWVREPMTAAQTTSRTFLCFNFSQEREPS